MVEIWFEVEDRYSLSGNTPVSIQTTNLLGSRNLSLSLLGKDKDKGNEIPENGFLTNTREGDLFAGLSNAADQLSGLLRENRENIKATIANIKLTTDRINDPAGEAVIPRLIHDREMGDSLKSTIRKLETVSDNIEKISTTFRTELDAGESLLARLIKDKETGRKFGEIVDRIETASKNIEQITTKINDPAGKGLIPRLIHDQKLADSVASTVEKIQGAAGEVETLVKDAREGDGRLGTILENFKAITRDAREMVAKVKKGEGTLGRIIMSDEIAENLNKLLKVAGDAIEDAREQAPIAAFGSMLLGGIQ